MGQDGKGLALAMPADDLLHVPLAPLVTLEKELGCLGKCPAKVGIADLPAGSAILLAIGLPGAFDEPAVGGEVLDPREAVDILYFIEQVQGNDPAHAGDGLEQAIGGGIMPLGTLDDLPLQHRQDLVIGIDHVQVGCHRHPDRRVVEPFQEIDPVCGLGDPAQGLLQVVLAGRVLDVCQQLGPLAHEMVAAAHQVPGCPHPCRIDIGHGDQATLEQGRDLMRVYLVVFALTAVDGPHIEGMAEDEGNPLCLAEISDPVPGEHALHADDDILAEGVNHAKEGLLAGPDVPVQADDPFPIQDAEIHFVGVHRSIPQ